MTLATFREPASMRAHSRAVRASGKSIAVVPTMGALHQGHLSLIELAASRADEVIATIFVNPTQFGAGEDLDAYPRQQREDLELALSAGATSAYCPTTEAMYPQGFETYIVPGPLADGLCGASRPGHFRGVATVVCKLFNATMPDIAVFGEKDYQQLAIIRRMTSDLDFDIEIVGGPIVREPDGLAMSSRNRYLDDDQRMQARALYRGLQAARKAHSGGQRSGAALEAMVRAELSAEPDVAIEYIEVRHSTTLEKLDHAREAAVLAVAARIGNTRLIDNVVLR